MKVSFDWMVSVILLPKTVSYAIFRPRLLSHQAFALPTDDWKTTQAPFGLLLATEITYVTYGFARHLKPDPAILAELPNMEYVDKLKALKNFLVLPSLSATMALCFLIFSLSAIYLLVLWRPVTHETASKAIRAAILAILPAFILNLVAADSWLRFEVKNPEVRSRLIAILEKGVSSADYQEIVSIVVPHWQFWVGIWPYLLSLIFFVFYPAMLVYHTRRSK